MSEEGSSQATETTGDGRRETPPPTRPTVAANERPSFVQPLLGSAVRGLGIIVCVVFAIFLARELGFFPAAGNVQQAPPQQARDATPAPATGAPLGIEDATISGEERAKLALAKSKQKRFISQADEVIDLAFDWLNELKKYNFEVSQLFKDDTGRGIAANRELVSQFGAVNDADRPTRMQAEDIRTNAEGLKAAVETSLKDPSDASIPSADLTRQLGEFLAQAKAGRDTYKKAREQLDSLVTQSRADGTKSRLTLKEALAELRREEGAKEAKTIEAARAKAHEEQTAKLAQEKAESERLEGEKQRQLELARRTTALAAKERERLLTLAKDPAIKADFQCFLAKGTWTFPPIDPINSMDKGPGQGHRGYSQRTAPASFSRLFEGGWLKDEEAFAVTRSGYVPTKVNFGLYNDRPPVPYPKTDEEWDRTKALYRRFLELAPIWVEMGDLEK